MEFPVCGIRFVLVAVFLVIQGSEAKNLQSIGFLNEMPKNCIGHEFCLNKHTNYPQEKIDHLLTEKYHLTLATPDEEPADRQGEFDEQFETDCEKNITYGEIYEIIDEDDNVRVVVQSPKIFNQRVRIEQCAHSGRLMQEGGTDHINSEELKDNNISCVEKNLDFNFVVLTRDGSGVEFVKSKHGIPVCCSCRLIS